VKASLMIITVLEVTLLCEADCLFTSGMKVRCWHEVGLHMTDYYARTHHHKSVKILQKNKNYIMVKKEKIITCAHMQV
jgi:hypothetical protein